LADPGPRLILRVQVERSSGAVAIYKGIREEYPETVDVHGGKIRHG